MSYSVKLAIFPPWKAPAPYATLEWAFATITDAARAAEAALHEITERELIEIARDLHSHTQFQGAIQLTAITVPDYAVHGFVVYDAKGWEVYNWTALDVAVQEADQHGG